MRAVDKGCQPKSAKARFNEFHNPIDVVRLHSSAGEMNQGLRKCAKGPISRVMVEEGLLDM